MNKFQIHFEFKQPTDTKPRKKENTKEMIFRFEKFILISTRKKKKKIAYQKARKNINFLKFVLFVC